MKWAQTVFVISLVLFCFVRSSNVYATAISMDQLSQLLPFNFQKLKELSKKNTLEEQGAFLQSEGVQLVVVSQANTLGSTDLFDKASRFYSKQVCLVRGALAGFILAGLPCSVLTPNGVIRVSDRSRPFGDQDLIVVKPRFAKDVLLHEFIHALIWKQKRQTRGLGRYEFASAVSREESFSDHEGRLREEVFINAMLLLHSEELGIAEAGQDFLVEMLADNLVGYTVPYFHDGLFSWELAHLKESLEAMIAEICSRKPTWHSKFQQTLNELHYREMQADFVSYTNTYLRLERDAQNERDQERAMRKYKRIAKISVGTLAAGAICYKLLASFGVILGH